MKSVNVNYCGEESPYTCTNPPPNSNPPPPARIGGSWTLSDQVNGKWYFGYVAGLGLDYALTQNLFLRGEFQYIQFGAPDNIRLSASSVRSGADGDAVHPFSIFAGGAGKRERRARRRIG